MPRNSEPLHRNATVEDLATAFETWLTDPHVHSDFIHQAVATPQLKLPPGSGAIRTPRMLAVNAARTRGHLLVGSEIAAARTCRQNWRNANSPNKAHQLELYQAALARVLAARARHFAATEAVHQVAVEELAAVALEAETAAVRAEREASAIEADRVEARRRLEATGASA